MFMCPRNLHKQQQQSSNKAHKQFSDPFRGTFFAVPAHTKNNWYITSGTEINQKIRTNRRLHWLFIVCRDRAPISTQITLEKITVYCYIMAKMTCCIVQIANACSGVIHPNQCGFDIEIGRAAAPEQQNSCYCLMARSAEIHIRRKANWELKHITYSRSGMELISSN